MKLWTNEDIAEIEKKTVEIKDWVNANKLHPNVKISPNQLLGIATAIEQTIEEIKFYKSKVEQLTKALEWYADRANYRREHTSLADGELYSAADSDQGMKARTFLKGTP